MRILFIGDIFAKPGIQITQQYLNLFRHDFDFIIANGENSAGGRGIGYKQFQQLRKAGIHVMTLGNHAWDNREALNIVNETPHLLRPGNYPTGTPGFGYYRFTSDKGEGITVANLMGRTFMDPLDCPFTAAELVLESSPTDEPLIIDFHAEATSEKKVMHYHVAGRASAVIGTHTHVQTADEVIRRGTAYISDVGMTGVQDSAIGLDFQGMHARFTQKLPQRLKAAEGAPTLCALAVTCEAAKAVKVERIQWQSDLLS